MKYYLLMMLVGLWTGCHPPVPPPDYDDSNDIDASRIIGANNIEPGQAGSTTIELNTREWYRGYNIKIELQFYRDGNIKTEFQFFHYMGRQVKHGYYNDYYVNGQIKTQGNYIDDMRSGMWTWYFEDSEVDVKRNYRG